MDDGLERDRIPDNFLDTQDDLGLRVGVLERTAVTLPQGDLRWRPIEFGGGDAAGRPSSPLDYEMYFDTTLGYPIWYDGSGWVDATGASA